MSAHRRPVIALTLSHDRIDTFWLTLLHEHTHDALHVDEDNRLFVDDLSLRPDGEHGTGSRERQADSWAAGPWYHGPPGRRERRGATPRPYPSTTSQSRSVFTQRWPRQNTT